MGLFINILLWPVLVYVSNGSVISIFEYLTVWRLRSKTFWFDLIKESTLSDSLLRWSIWSFMSGMMEFRRVEVTVGF